MNLSFIYTFLRNVYRSCYIYILIMFRIIYIYIYIYIYIHEYAYDKFPDVFRMGTFIDSIHIKLWSPSK